MKHKYSKTIGQDSPGSCFFYDILRHIDIIYMSYVKNYQIKIMKLCNMYNVKVLTRKYLSNCTKYNDKLRGECYNQKQESDTCFAKNEGGLSTWQNM